MSHRRTVIAQSRTVPAARDELWPELIDPQRFREWFAFCDEVEAPTPTRRVLYGSWGSQRSAVTVEFLDVDEPRRLTYTHVEETLDGRPARALSISTQVEFDLQERPDGQTEVTITSVQVPATLLARVVTGVFGRRAIRGMLEQSLDMLAHRHT